MQKYWLAFAKVNGLGPIRLQKIRAAFDSIEAAWFADPADLHAIGLPRDTVEQQQNLRRLLDPDTLIREVEQLGARVLTLDDPAYPLLLRQLEDSPPILYIKGELTPNDEQALAIVGTRRASAYGKAMTQALTSQLAQRGITIVSGLAYGIDSIAHQTALEHGGRTIAVLGSGIDMIYPSEHRHIADDIVHNGAIITEFPPGTKPERGNFPIRNRIISGISLGTLVVEAPERSGALQTANIAAEQGRDVFAVPGNANSPNSIGTNRLIQDGAKLAMTADDILDELMLRLQTQRTQTQVKQIAPESPLELKIVELVSLDSLHVDDIARACGLAIQEVNATLALMELKGLVYQETPMRYHAVHLHNVDKRI